MLDFLNPAMGWAALSVAIPVAIHLWHRKRARLIEWAAMQWLVEIAKQEQRGLRLQHLWLLLLRCLLLLTLVTILAQPYWSGLPASTNEEVVHWVQPDQALAEMYRFELETALQNGQQVYWFDEDLSELKDVMQVPTSPTSSMAARMHRVSSRYSTAAVRFHLYLINDQSLWELYGQSLPSKPILHTLDATAAPHTSAYITNTEGTKRLWVDENGRLAQASPPYPALRWAAAPLRKEPLFYSLHALSEAEQPVVRAATSALQQTFGLPLVEEATEEKNAQWQFGSRTVADRSPAAFSTVSQRVLPVLSKREHTSPEAWDGEAELVTTGQFPEWLGEQALQQLGLWPKEKPLSQAQLNSLFRMSSLAKQDGVAALRTLLLGLLLVLVILERWIAFRYSL